MPIKWTITPELHDLIFKLYHSAPSGRGQLKEFCKKHNLPRHVPSWYAIKQGWVQPRNKKPEWTESELKILERNAHCCIEVIQRKLKKAGWNRTKTAISVKKKRMRFNQNLEGQSAYELSQCFGIDRNSIARHIKAGRLKASKRQTHKVEANGGDPYYIKDKDIKKFIIEYIDIIDIRKIDKYWLVDILTATGL